MTLSYGFQILSEAQVQESNTINSRLGNMNTSERNARKNNSDNLGKFVSTPYLSHEGDTVYLCSNTVSGHAGVLPTQWAREHVIHVVSQLHLLLAKG